MDSREGLIKGSLYCPDNVQQTERERDLWRSLWVWRWPPALWATGALGPPLLKQAPITITNTTYVFTALGMILDGQHKTRCWCRRFCQSFTLRGCLSAKKQKDCIKEPGCCWLKPDTLEQDTVPAKPASNFNSLPEAQILLNWALGWKSKLGKNSNFKNILIYLRE